MKIPFFKFIALTGFLHFFVIPSASANEITNKRTLQRIKQDIQRLVGKGKLHFSRIEEETGVRFLKDHRLYQVQVEENVLEIIIYPAGGSIGFFADEGKNVTALRADNDGLESVAKKENLAKRDDIPAAEMATLILMGKFRDGPRLLKDPQELLQLEGDGFTLHPEKKNRLLKAIKAPQWISGNPKKLVFYTAVSWMFPGNKIVRMTVNFGPNSQMMVREETVAKDISSTIPDVMI